MATFREPGGRPGTLISSMVLSFLALSLLAGPKIMVDGKLVPSRGAKVYRGRMLVPMRAIFQAVGAYVEYIPADRAISARKEGETLDFRIGEKIAKKNGAEIDLDVAPVVIGGVVMVPLRFVTESLGARVDFDRATNTVNVFTKVDPDGIGSDKG